MPQPDVLETLNSCRVLYYRIYNVEEYILSAIEINILIELKKLLNGGLLNTPELFDKTGITLEQIVFLVGVHGTIPRFEDQ